MSKMQLGIQSQISGRANGCHNETYAVIHIYVQPGMQMLSENVTGLT